MIKIKKVKIPAQPARIEKREVYYCDICKEQTSSHWVCCLCGRITCTGWTKGKGCCGHFDPNDIGDYPDIYCDICYKLRFGKYKKEFEEMDTKHDKEEKELTEKIRKESLNENNRKQ